MADTVMVSPNHPEIVRQQYATDEKLRIRQEIHERYSFPQVHFAEWALNCIKWRGDEKLLDVGCGPGVYYQKLRQKFPEGIDYHGVDTSIGMLSKHPAKSRNLALASAEDLPYLDHSFDVVMANHMLYHVANVEAAIAEFKRVLKPGGTLMVATNSIDSMPEMQVLMRRAIVLLTRHPASTVRPPEPTSNRFALENGTRALSREFYAVVRHDLPSKLIFKQVDPAIAYLESKRDSREPQLPDDVVWEDVMMIMRQQVTQLINHLEELEINKLSGVLLATNNGSFIQEFVEVRQHSNSTHE